MGIMYSASFEEVNVTAAQDLFELLVAAAAAVKVHQVTITQSSDAGDAQAEMLPILIHRGTATGTGGTTVTPSPTNIGDPVYSGTVEANNTTQSAEGTFIHAEAFNVQIGFYYMPTPKGQFWIPPSGFFIVELQAAPNDGLLMNGTILFEEFNF